MEAPRTTPRGPAARRALSSIPALIALLAAACGGGETEVPEEPPTTRPNILLISLDTLRADHLGCYGYERPTSPHLDRLAERSVRFADARAPSSWTFPSHASMFAGLNPMEIGVLTLDDRIPARTSLIAELLSEVGYQTAAFVDSGPRGFLGAERGFDRGFDRFSHCPHRENAARKMDAAVTVDTAISWLDGRAAEKPFFLFVHTKDVHTAPANTPRPDALHFPYEKPEPYRLRFVPESGPQSAWSSPERAGGVEFLYDLNEGYLRGERDPADFSAEDLEDLRALYDAGVYYVDEHLGRLFAHLEKTGLDENLVVIVVSDHGESFLEHHLFLHREVYDSVLRVPLLVHLPGQVNGRVEERRVDLSDVAVTILRLAGLPIPAAMTGQDLLRDEPEPDSGPRTLIASNLRRDRYQAASLVVGRWKLVLHTFAGEEKWASELYDLQLDPEERNPVDDHPSVESRLREVLQRWIEESRSREVHKIELDPETLEELRNLGYVGDR